MKRQQLLEDILKKGVLGVVAAYMAVIEFQKRGLPHMHLVLILNNETRPKSADDYDRFVCAEIPPPSCAKLRELVLRFHIHGPCGRINPNCPCMENKVCTKHYPKQYCKSSLEGDNGIAEYRRRSPEDNGESAESNLRKKKINLTNRNVVPYNAALLMKYKCHLNLEIASGKGRMVKYLYKYLLKGPDYVSFKIVSSISKDTSESKQQGDSKNDSDSKSGRDEIAEYVCHIPLRS